MEENNMKLETSKKNLEEKFITEADSSQGAEEKRLSIKNLFNAFNQLKPVVQETYDKSKKQFATRDKYKIEEGLISTPNTDTMLRRGVREIKENKEEFATSYGHQYTLAPEVKKVHCALTKNSDSTPYVKHKGGVKKQVDEYEEESSGENSDAISRLSHKSGSKQVDEYEEESSIKFSSKNSDSISGASHKKVVREKEDEQIEEIAVAKDSDGVFGILKIIWNNTVQKLTEFVAPIKKTLIDSAIILTKKSLSCVDELIKVCFKDIDKYLDDEVEKYFNSIVSKDSDSFATKIWNSVKLVLVKPLVDVLVTALKSAEKKFETYLSDALSSIMNTDEENDKENPNSDKQLEVLSQANAKTLKKNAEEEYLNLKNLFSECGNAVSASIINEVGSIAGMDFFDNANLEPSIVGKCCHSCCVIF